MKLLHFLLLTSLFIFISCKPLSLGVSGSGESEYFNDDSGQDDYQKVVKDLNIEELKEKGSGEKCSEYKNSGSFSLFGDASLLEPIRNCFAQKIDQGLRPLCEQEKELKRELRDESDPGAIAEIEEELDEIEEAKYFIADDLYLIAADFDDIEEDVSEDFEKERSDHDPWGNLANTVVSIYVKSELGGFTRFLNSKIRNACRGVNVRRR